MLSFQGPFVGKTGGWGGPVERRSNRTAEGMQRLNKEERVEVGRPAGHASR